MKRLVIVGIAALALAAPMASAKSLSKIMGESGLSPEDMTAMGAASASLYKDTTPGASARWKNDATKSYGTVKIKSYDGTCVVLDHAIHAKGAAQARPFVNKHCKNAQGHWGAGE